MKIKEFADKLGIKPSVVLTIIDKQLLTYTASRDFDIDINDEFCNKVIDNAKQLKNKVIDKDIIINNSISKDKILLPLRNENKHFIYFLISENEVVYIGQSCDLPTRIDAHNKNKTFKNINYIEIKKEDALYYEGLYTYILISHYKHYGKDCIKYIIDDYRHLLQQYKLSF